MPKTVHPNHEGFLRQCYKSGVSEEAAARMLVEHTKQAMAAGARYSPRDPIAREFIPYGLKQLLTTPHP